MMAEAAHTPGSWHTRIATASRPTTHLIDSQGQHLASFNSKNHAANAVLAAAAPDLLAAGQALYDAIGAFDFRDGERPLQNRKIIEAGEAWSAAFRKATLSRNSVTERRHDRKTAANFAAKARL